MPWLKCDKHQSRISHVLAHIYSRLNVITVLFVCVALQFFQFLGITSIKQMIKCLGQRHNIMPLVNLKLATGSAVAQW